MINYKLGDKVIIKVREGRGEDYPFTFSSSMTKYSGKTAIIKKIGDYSINKSAYKYYNGDDHEYYLDIDGEDYVWHSSMFDPYAEDILPDEDISEEYIVVNDKNTFLFKENISVLYNGSEEKIITLDEGDWSEPYKLSNEAWVHREEIVPNFLKILQSNKAAVYFSRIFGKMIVTKNDSFEYPLLATLSDGDQFELTSDFKYFTNSDTYIL